METALMLLVCLNVVVSSVTLVMLGYSKADTVIKPFVPSGVAIRRDKGKRKPVYNDEKKAFLAEEKEKKTAIPMV